MRHAEQHAKSKTRERRQRLAIEAARLMAEGGIRDFHQAKLKAAARLGIHDDASLPRNTEIEDALREHQRLFQSDSQPLALVQRRRAAIQAMALLERFEPRLVGGVLEGTADQHSPVQLHLYCDEPHGVEWFLSERGIRFETRTRHYRLDAEREIDCPIVSFSADDVGFELSIFDLDGLRQAPLDRVDGRPMARAGIAAVRALVEADTE